MENKEIPKKQIFLGEIFQINGVDYAATSDNRGNNIHVGRCDFVPEPSQPVRSAEERKGIQHEDEGERKLQPFEIKWYNQAIDDCLKILQENDYSTNAPLKRLVRELKKSYASQFKSKETKEIHLTEEEQGLNNELG